ncbi:hypothetical protein DPMN_036087 [Dreissena polymorpha]|uniref:CCHC-type domain-containing protein n=1 Tax=Dreissena polymorpha TaxID=45954 RepID=A0A9D4RLM6_DREPO|nr:hypothetical protein DPMN_036087 [Dreissena polymorpha]
MTEQDVHRIHARGAGSAVQPQRQQLQPDRRSGPNIARVKTREHFKQSCDFCGRKHPKTAKCPAKGVTCHNCGNNNHFAKVCRSKNVHEMSAETNSLCYETDIACLNMDCNIDIVSKLSSHPDRAFVQLNAPPVSRFNLK